MINTIQKLYNAVSFFRGKLNERERFMPMKYSHGYYIYLNNNIKVFNPNISEELYQVLANNFNSTSFSVDELFELTIKIRSRKLYKILSYERVSKTLC